MGDSDEEYERRGRGRDKFKRERVDYDPSPRTNDRNEMSLNNSGWTNSGGRYSGHRGYDRNSGGGGGGGAGGGGGGGRNRMDRRDYRDDSPPSNKRGRNSRPGDRDYDGPRHERNTPREDIYSLPLLTVRNFILESPVDSFNDRNLLEKYNAYKVEHKRRSILDFFNQHKDEEWFRLKYLPEEVEKASAEKRKFVEDRLRVFKELETTNMFDGPILDIDKSEEIVRILDTAVIKLEGGTDFDLLALNEKPKAARLPCESVFAVITEPVKESPEVPAPPKDENQASVDEMSGAEESKSVEPGESVSEPVEMAADGGDAHNLPSSSEDGAEVKPKPRALHRTASIFFRNILPHITKQDIEDECRKYPGFLRLALSEPIQIDKTRFTRRGWATYEGSVDIKQISWNLSNVKFRGTDIGPIVNRMLLMRTRSVAGLASHKTVAQQDIRLAARLIMKLDKEIGLWEDPEADKEGNAPPSRNPLISSITEYLVEEAPAEEEELLGIPIEFDPITGEEIKPTDENDSQSSEAQCIQIVRDDVLLKVLDKLIFYLRIVHSFDFYKNDFYLDEDHKPNRIGVIHARGLVSSGKIPPHEIIEWRDSWKTLFEATIAEESVIPVEEAKKFGYKTPDEAVEQFIKDNTQELGEGKYLCPLSNKKFMGPEFVRKHILNKHEESVEQVKSESLYMNNYILDAKRPPQQQQDAPQNKTPIANLPFRSPGNRLAGRLGPPNNDFNNSRPFNNNNGPYNHNNSYQRFNQRRDRPRYPYQRDERDIQQPETRELIVYDDLDADDLNFN